MKVGRSQRKKGAHTDGFQDADNAYNSQRVIDHTYVVSDQVPTEFFNQAFPLERVPPGHEPEYFDAALDLDAKVTMPGYVVSLIDAYTVHRVGIAAKNTKRTFVRITFSKQKFIKEGNTLNPDVDYSSWFWSASKRTEAVMDPE